MPELLIAVLFFAVTARYAGEKGGRRFRDLSQKRAEGVHDSFASRTFDWLILLNIAVSAVNAGLAVYLNSWVYLALSLAALALSLAARAIRPRARANVNAAFAEWGLEPLMRRETSARRERRQKQFGSIALIGYLCGRVLDVIAEQTNATWPEVLLLPVMVLTLGGGVALLWSMAWRFGDERPA